MESSLAVAFERPVDGTRFAVTEDADPATDGFQTDVAVVARDTSGRAVTLASAKLETRVPSTDAWTAGPDAALDGGRATFAHVTLQPRTNLLRVTVVEQGSQRTATQTITVAVGADTPTLDIATPAEGQVLREADDADAATPGYQVGFTVRATALRGASGFITCGGVCGIAPVPFTVGEDGQAKVVVTLSEPVREAQQAQCVAVVKRPSGDVTSPPRGMTLDTEAPRLALASPEGPVASTTFPVVAVVRSVENGVAATLTREGGETLTASVQAGAVSFPAVTVPGDGTYAFRLRVADSGGNVTETSFDVLVASAAPVLTLEAPTTVAADADGDATNGVQADAQVKVNGLPVGAEVALWTSVNGQLGQPQRVKTVTSGTDRVARFTLALAEGANSLKACVKNAAGIEACRLSTVTVSTGRPSCRIVSPTDGTLVAASGAALSVRVESANNGPVGLTAAQGTQTATASGTASGGAASLSVTLPAKDGTWRLVATCPGGGVSQALPVYLDTTAPTVAVAVRDAADGHIDASFVDTSVQPGTQVVLDATTEPFARLSVTGCGLPSALEASADSAGRVAVTDVTVPQSGACDLTVQATDLAGNTGSSKLSVTSALAVSTLSFTSPDPRRVLGQSDGTPLADDGLAVPVKLAFSAGAVGELKLYRDTAQVGTTPVVVADTEKTFAAVALASGVNVVRAVLSNTGGAGACASALYTVAVKPGAISLTAPGSSASFNLTEDRDPSTPGIQRPLSYSLNGASSGAVVDVCTSVALSASATPCRDGSGWFTLASGVPTNNPLFNFPDGAYQLKVVLEDGGRVSESAQVVSLVVDGHRPEVTALEFVGDANGDRVLNATESPSGAPVLRVSTAGLEAGRPIQVRDRTTNVLYGQASSTGNTTDVTLGSLPGGEADYKLVVVVTDIAGNANKTVESQPADPLDPVNETARTDFRLDRVAPALTISAPGNNAVLGPAQDADPATAGFQVRVTVQVASTDVAAPGVTLRLMPDDVSVNVTPSNGTVTHDFTVAGSGTHGYTVSASARDTSGNASAPVSSSVTVDLEAPVLTLESPASGAVLDDANVPVRVSVSGGEGLRVFVYSAPAGGGPRQPVGSLLVSGGVAQGTLTFPVGLQDVSVDITDAAGNSASRVSTGVNVRLIGCDVTLTSPDTTPVTFLAKDDADPTTAGLQYTLRGHTTRCGGRTVTLYKGGAQVAVTTADVSTGAFSFALSLADGEQSTLKAEMVDDALNKTSDSVDYAVDVTPAVFTTVSPAETSLTFVAASNIHLVPVKQAGYVQDLTAGGNAEANFDVTVKGATGGKVQAFYQGAAVSPAYDVTADPQTVTVSLTLPHNTSGALDLKLLDASGNETVRTSSAVVDVIAPAALTPTFSIPTGGARKALLDVTWAAGGDDGTQGQAAGYDVRWSTQALLDKGVPDEATYYGSKLKQVSGGLLAAGTTSTRLSVPPLGTYLVGVRPVDEVGNIAPFSGVASFNGFTTVTLQNPGASGRYGFIMSSGDLDGDGKDDIVTSDYQSSSNRGSVYVYYDVTAAGGPTLQTLLPPTPDLQQYGIEVSVGNVGDAAGEGRPDLLVAAPLWSSSRGRAFLYFGRKNAQLDPTPVEFRGRTGVGTTNFGYASRVIGDLDGDGLSEVLFSADRESDAASTPTWKGRVYLFFGRSRAAWQALATGLEADNVPFIPVDSADLVFEGPLTPSPSDPSNFFGRRRGQANVGDLDGDTKPELAIGAPFDKLNAVYVYPGSVLQSRRGGATPAARTVKLADALQTLSPGTAATSGSNGFGVDLVGGLNFTGGSAKDLVVTHPLQNLLRLYPDGGASGFTSPELTINVAPDPEVPSPRFFGYSVVSADINQDGLPDLVCGEGAGTKSSAWIFFNRGASAGAPFDRIGGDIDSTVPGDGFSQVRFKGLKSLGTGVAVGDFNGDGNLDVASGDTFDAPGKVLVWY